MKKILVTGANGQLGKCIQKIEENYPDFQFIFKKSKELDITNSEIAESLFETIKPDFCINCAAYTNVEQAEKTPKKAYKVNAEGVKTLALICKSHQVILIHISTDYVFDGRKEQPYTINDIPNPINEYGKSKLQGEKCIQEILEKYLIIRTSWMYSEFGNNFYKTILKKAKNRDVLYITDNQIGCPTNANNLAYFILQNIIENNIEFGIHHFTDQQAMTWYGFAKLILEENNLAEKVKLVQDKKYRSFAPRPKNSVLKQ